MRTKVKRASPEAALMRVLDALAQEAIEASDEEVAAAATDLRMDLNERESAAFAGLTYFARPQLSDFFDVESFKSLQAPTEPIAGTPAARPRVRQRHSKRSQIATERKPPGGGK
jgi:hypothetical protein